MMTQAGLADAFQPIPSAAMAGIGPLDAPGAARLDFISPYLNRPLRRIEDVERSRQSKPGKPKPADGTPDERRISQEPEKAPERRP